MSIAARFDHIVVGAGSAGAVVAARLSEDPQTSVLLIEAGPDNHSAGTPDGVAGVDFWAALAEPGRAWADLDAAYVRGRRGPYPRGRGVGGSSAVNALIGIRGLAADYDTWAHDLGCTGWDAATMGRLFDAIEADDARHPSPDAAAGALPLHRPPVAEWSPVEQALRTASLELGYDWCADYHVPDSQGIGPAALTIRNGRRVSTNDAYLEVARTRSNLSVRGGTSVDRVLLDGSRVVGVRTATGEDIEAASVVVAAGAIHSPAILLRSGIGGADGLPVGANLIEHPAAGLVLAVGPSGRMEGDRPVLSSLLRYSSGLAGAGPQDMQVVPLGSGPQPAGSSIAILNVAAMQVFSRGNVTLRSDDPAIDPDADFALLSDDRDRVRLADGIARVRQLLRQPAFSELVDGVYAGPIPLDDLSEDAIDEWLDANAVGYAHAVGTCRMGSVGDPRAVVDPDCAVIGYDGLHVVDASVMPDIPRANTHLTTVAIAERISAHLRLTARPAVHSGQ